MELVTPGSAVRHLLICSQTPYRLHYAARYDDDDDLCTCELVKTEQNHWQTVG